MNALVNPDIGKVIVEAESKQHILTATEARTLGATLLAMAEVLEPLQVSGPTMAAAIATEKLDMGTPLKAEKKKK